MIIRDEADILRFALEAARRCGDPDPELIQHTVGTREAATRSTGSWVHGDQRSYLIAIRGRFSAPRPSPGPLPGETPAETRKREAEPRPFSVLVRVIDVDTGRVTDSGGSDAYPDLALVGSVITDYPTASDETPRG